ncbi:MAG: baseplate J/gp47 family protein [Victivallaceae bacterium]|nr:baseplate J/gp47 family protein [Victivallaceae bacterium]
MIDTSSLSATEKIFFAALVDSGVPETEALFKAQMQAQAEAASLPIANPSAYSAFWNFVKSAVTAPFQSIVRTLVTVEMPGFYARTAAGSRLDLIAWAYGLERKAAAKMTGLLTFYRASGVSGAVEIPAGSRARSIAINGTVYRAVTTEDSFIPDGQSSVAVPAEAEAAGENYNLGAGYYSLLDSDVPGAGSVTNLADYLVTPGADAEPDDELRLRIRNQFLAVGDWHTDAKYRAIVTARSGISPDRCYFDHTNPRGPGSADCYIIFEAGTTPAAYLADLNDYITNQGNHGHGDDLVCKAIPETAYDLAATCRFDAAATTDRKAACLAVIEAMIRCAFWENSDYDAAVERTWPYATFSFSRLAAALHKAVPELSSIVFSRGDITSALDLPKLGTLTVSE